MFVGEDKKKVTNIVKGSLTEFQDLYSPFLTNLVDFLPDNRLMKVNSNTCVWCSLYAYVQKCNNYEKSGVEYKACSLITAKNQGNAGEDLEHTVTYPTVLHAKRQEWEF